VKLYYFKDPSGNFGDDLNPWLWSKLMPEVLDQDESEIFVGIGTLLNNKLPVAPIKHIFGSGLGYGKTPAIDEKYVFHAVRGFFTARELALPEDLVITDGAVLVRAVSPDMAKEKVHRFGFMPTGETIHNYDWETICHELGICYISCHMVVEEAIYAISQCETLITEAMHGAIVADAIRVPWIPVCCNENILRFKWEDWLSTMDLPYLPNRVSPLFNLEIGFDLKSRAKNSIKRVLIKSGVWSSGWTMPNPRNSSVEDRERTLEQFQHVTRLQAFLSSDLVIESHTNRYLELIGKFKQDVKKSSCNRR
jgi:succinoglycan biosynthesis protein ExoV